MESGTIIHINAQNKEWGRIASDGYYIQSINEKRSLVWVKSIRSNVIVNNNEISIKRKESNNE
jgi:hypothetical protein